MLLDKHREINETLWLNRVFDDIYTNDCSPVAQVVLQEHENHNISSVSTVDKYTSDSNYKLISSMHLQHDYQDPDNPFKPAVSPHDGYQWEKDSNHKWRPPTHDNPNEHIHSKISLLAYANNIHQHSSKCEQETDQFTIAHIRDTAPLSSNKVIFSSTSSQQSDTGANTNATNNLNLLHDVVYIKPVQVNSASVANPMKMLAIGRIHLQCTNGEILKPISYYSPDIDGTIISPTAIVREFNDRFTGFSKVCDCSKKQGYLSFNTHDANAQQAIIPLTSKNDLWYHSFSTSHTPHSNLDTTKSINRLSQAANYELWHQRLCHPGQTIMDTIHKHADNVPKLKGNSFWKCPSCMQGKCTKSYHTKQCKPKQKSKFKKVTLQDLLYQDPEKDDIYLPKALPGQHFHCDFGFMRSKNFQQVDQQGNLQTSIDGKRAYLIIVDRFTRYMWVYVSNSKEPPLDFCRKVFNKFKASVKHKTIRCDQGELASSNAFNDMIVEEGFTLEVTGSNNSKQNGLAERPHRTLAQMVRCVLHSAGLGPEYWSYALIHCVYVKNRLPHASISKSPYEAFTGLKPQLENLRIFGSRVVAQTPRSKTGKLDLNNVAEGIFVGFTGTDKNIWYIDDKTRKPKIGSWVDFDEAHFSVPTQFAPLAAQALQRVGYYVDEDDKPPVVSPIDVHLHSLTAKPIHLSTNGLYYDVPLDISPLVVLPGQTKLLQTGNSINTNGCGNWEIKQRHHHHLHHLMVFPGMISTSKDREIFIIVHNFGQKDIVLTDSDEIATLHLLDSKIQPINVMPFIPPKHIQDYLKQPNPFRSQPIKSKLQSSQTPHPQSNTSPLRFSQRLRNQKIPAHVNARAAKLEASMQVSIDMPYDLNMDSDPYNNHTHRVITMTSRSPTLGLKIDTCPKRHLPILKTCMPGQPAAKIPNWRKDLKNAYITQVNDKSVKTKADIIRQIELCRLLKMKDVTIKFSTIERQGLHPQLGIPQLYHDQLSTIAQHLFDIRHDTHNNINQLCASLPNVLNSHPDAINNNIGSTTKNLVTPSTSNSPIISKVKQKHNHFTLSQLKKRDDWPEWEESIFRQLDQYANQNTFSEPQPLPRGANLLSLCWVYLIKTDGLNTKKARCVCNGSPRFRGTVTLAQTYASALDQTGAKIFWASVAINNYIVLGADASNAFAEAPPPKAPLYVRLDDNYKRWYAQRHPEKPPLPDDYVVKVQKALQGHPESPRLWAELIDGIIQQLNLKPCTHEKCLYYTENYNNTGKRVLFLRQVDDFAIACQDTTLARQVIQDINSKMTIDVKILGLISRFNGVDIDQTREYVKLHNTTYINKLLAQHAWLSNDDDPIHSQPLPMNPDNAYQKKLESASAMTIQEKVILERKLGFSYRQAIGEIIYAMITCRPDISYAIIKLSQYSTRPAAIHYNALIHLYKYLKATKTDGIYYWRSHPRDDLPSGSIPVVKIDNNYDEEQVSARHTTNNTLITAYVDSDHASDSSHRRSISGFHIKLAGGTVLYKTKYQNIVAQSSTEAEFIAAAEAGRYILYLRTIMAEIGLPQHHATVLFEDNQGALLMAQAGQPTKRTKHIDTRYYAIQSWVERDMIQFKRICTTDNSADSMTKATARTLFYRHNQHIMGKLIPHYAKFLRDKNIQESSQVHSTKYHISCLALNVFSAKGYTHSS